MDTFLSQLGTAAIDNALSLGMLLAAVWWFAKRDAIREKKIEDLNIEKTQILKDALDKSNTVISANTLQSQASAQAFNSLKEAIQRNG